MSVTLTGRDSGPSSPLDLTSATSTTPIVSSDVTGDSADRFKIDATGKITWGSGSAAADVNLYRSAANVLKTDDTLFAGDGSTWAYNCNGGGRGFSSWGLPSAAQEAFGTSIAGDSNWRCRIYSNGKIQWGSGAAGEDTNLYRAAADWLITDDRFSAQRLEANGTVATQLVVKVKGAPAQTADLQEWQDSAGTVLNAVRGDGGLQLANTVAIFGKDTGGTTRSLLSVTSGDVVNIGTGALPARIFGTQLGFFGASAVSKPTVTGSRAAGTALTSLLSQLAALGLITNSTSA